ncbi:hypothetical protein QBC38DRAFT_111628 [Podospora fimiseda]|uniref:Uncharacterized protein n=1 Tax=Podospora fimiseda TaxID=252190 RepID=A0AAN7BF76_9PEZI|nr:hypothetical protein QBC38DRAFT_111628 [Podospora fimiseda]
MPRHNDFPHNTESPSRRINTWDDGGYFPQSSSPPPHYNDSRSRPRHRSPSPYNNHRSYSPSPVRNPYNHNNNNSPGRPPLQRSKSTTAKAFAKESLHTLQHLSPQWQKAAKAALQAGGMAALAQRKKSGAWAGAKGARVATAAIGAVAADVIARRGKEKMEGHGNRDRDRSRDRDYNRRDRSRDKDYDRRDRERDRSYERDYERRDRGRDRSYDERDDYERRDRGKSKKRGGNGEPIEFITEFVGGLIKEQIAKRVVGNHGPRY